MSHLLFAVKHTAASSALPLTTEYEPTAQLLSDIATKVTSIDNNFFISQGYNS